GGSQQLGIRDADNGTAPTAHSLNVDLAAVNARVRELAAAQSVDIRSSLVEAGVRVVDGTGRLDGPDRVEVLAGDGRRIESLEADVILLAVGARPRELDSAPCDGERILNWTQLYELDALPEHLIVVGSGVTGAEFASAYRALGSEVTLVSSRDKVLPGTDAEAADVLEEAFGRRGVTVRSRSRAETARRTDDGVVVTLTTGEEIAGSHVLIAIGGIPWTADLGLETAGVRVRDSGHIETDRVSRTSVRGIYAAGDCTGVYPLASVAAMQGRIAMHHALGDAVSPLIAAQVSSAIFTSPEIAVVGVSEQEVLDGEVSGEVMVLRLDTNPRAKMQGLTEGFVKLIVRPGSHTVIGAVVVAPRASELILPYTLAVAHRLTAEQVAGTFTIYPSLTGSLAEVASQRVLAPDACGTGPGPGERPGACRSVLDRAEHGTGGDCRPDLGADALDDAGAVRGDRLLHLHRLEDDQQVTVGHGLTLLGDHLDDGALHRCGDAVAAARGLPGRTVLPLAALSHGGLGRAQRGGQADLDPAAVHLDDHGLAILGLLGLAGQRRGRQVVVELGLDPGGVHREGLLGVLGGEGRVLDHLAVEREDRRDALDVELGQRAAGALERLPAGGAGDDELGQHRVEGPGDLVPGAHPGLDAHTRARGHVVALDPAGRGHEAAARVLAVDPELEGVA